MVAARSIGHLSKSQDATSSRGRTRIFHYTARLSSSHVRYWMPHFFGSRSSREGGSSSSACRISVPLYLVPANPVTNRTTSALIFFPTRRQRDGLLHHLNRRRLPLILAGPHFRSIAGRTGRLEQPCIDQHGRDKEGLVPHLTPDESQGHGLVIQIRPSAITSPGHGRVVTTMLVPRVTHHALELVPQRLAHHGRGGVGSHIQMLAECHPGIIFGKFRGDWKESR